MDTSVVCILKLVGAIFVVVLKLFVNGAVGCLENEKHALLQLKASLVGNYETSLLTTWDSKSDGCCAWEGIGCSNQTGHVERLDLNQDQFGPFQGEINASVMELRHLVYLNLSHCLISNSIFPEFFDSLSNLKFLDLQSSSYSTEISSGFARLGNLQYLDLSSNSLEGTIPRQFGSLLHLQYLDLSYNALDGTIPRHLGNLSRLQYLDLSYNGLDGTIPHQLGSLSNLQELHLQYNQGLKVDDENNHVGGQWFSNLTLLTHLDLSGMPYLNSSHVWLQTIAKLPKIQELRLSGCALSDLYLFSLSRSRLSFSTSLSILDLSLNTFSSSKIFEWVFNVTSNFIELDLSSNNFNGTIPYDFGNINCKSHTLHSLHFDYNNLNEDISTILLKLSGCVRYSLQGFSLRHNQITGTLPNLSIFPSLTTIDLSFNTLSGKLPDEIPKSLESLIFESNSLEGGVPKSFGNLCSLKLLDLSSNKLSEDLTQILHNLSVGCAKYSLQELNLGSNQIIGTVPDLSGLSALKNLYLSNNLLHGKIVQKSPFPYQLEVLNLDSNNFEGVISDSHFRNMSLLTNLNLNGNSLSLIFSENWIAPFHLSSLRLRSCVLGSSFPKWLQSQKHLYDLEISNAKISDVVPVWFWTQAKNLVFMNISHNNLTGTIPNLSITFSKDCTLILDSNQFEGPIPPFFGSATFLRLSKNKFSETTSFLCTNTTVYRLFLLDLSKNQLSRQLPNCWDNLSALQFLDLSDNTLSGEVPSSMGSLLELKVLILRNNTFTGKLPVSLKNCIELIMLDVGNNRFSGPIPNWLGQQLQMLSLRKNQFYGSLPRSLCYLTNIQLLDLSENNLSGRIFKCMNNFSAMSQDVLSAISTESVLYYTVTYRENFEGFDIIALLMWKGTEQQFKNNKLILRSIDLSSNQLIGEIPKEIENLIELVSLNLSSNHLTGKITSEIGRLTSLEFLDLSRNHLFGPIPSSLAQIDRLSLLNLSNNNLSGRIPIGTQLQSFVASSYEGNADLCGKPLDKKCPGDEEAAHEKPETIEESSPEDKKSIYLSVGLGFITGFWALFAGKVSLSISNRIICNFVEEK
ncbi:unnamed protein product [Vicia faba]|uniref:Leucine-rich repeat-containing N-terminal plant-type domain-containing protein n=1 Tax=Vicia faba TaxID=3906 RepID=A0AAV0YRA2_VICFA|nr:unnamed protein product [Vicia faba]